eukprot:15398474-Alexandrium_andersonii.AAC.1
MQECECSLCGCLFAGTAALKVHAARVHQVRSRAFRFASGEGTCACCLRCFHDRPRLAYHLNSAQTAYIDFYEARIEPLSEAELGAAIRTAAEKQRQARKAGAEHRKA